MNATLVNAASIRLAIEVRVFNIIAVLLASFLLAASHTALAQGLDEATSLNQQAIHLYGRGRYSDAIPLAQRAFAVQEKELGPNHPDVATSLNNLALLYSAEGRYADAEPLAKRSLAIGEKKSARSRSSQCRDILE